MVSCEGSATTDMAGQEKCRGERKGGAALLRLFRLLESRLRRAGRAAPGTPSVTCTGEWQAASRSSRSSPTATATTPGVLPLEHLLPFDLPGLSRPSSAYHLQPAAQLSSSAPGLRASRMGQAGEQEGDGTAGLLV